MKSWHALIPQRLRRQLFGRASGREHRHVATFNETIIYFTFVFGSTPQSPHAVATRLLGAGIAETVTSPANDEIRMAPRYKKLARAIQDANRITEMHRTLAERGIAPWAARNPFAFVGLTFRIAIGKLRAAAWREEADEDSKERHGDVGIRMNDFVTDIEEAVVERQALNAIQHAREQDMYQNAYLESEPYLRLSLRSTNFGLAGFADGRHIADGQVSEVLMLVHRSGVMHLTLPVRMPNGVGTNELIARMTAKGVRLSWTELAETILAPASRRAGGGTRDYPGEWLPEIAEGTRWRRFEHPDPATLVDLFHLYRDAISQAARLEMIDEWFCYPVLCIDQLGCCQTESKWIAQHQLELNGILTRFQDYSRLRAPSKITLPIDSSIVQDQSVWHSHALTTRISWSRDSGQFADHLWTVLLAENFLLQYWQLRQLGTSMQSIGIDPAAKTARAVQRELIFGLDEFYRSSLSYGDAQQTVTRLLRESGADRMHAQLTERLDQLGTLVAAERAESGARRAIAAAVVAFIAAVAFGMPAVDQTLNLAKDIPHDSLAGYLASPLRGVAEFGAAGSYFCYVSMLALLLVVIVVLALPSRQRRRRLRRARMAGWSWIGPNIIVDRQNDDNGSVTQDDSTTRGPLPSS